jgi:hypothetical protein
MSNILVAAITGLAALGGALIGSLYQHASRERELDIKMVEIAVNILRAKPEPSVQPVREWAVAVMDKYSGLKLSDDARRVLLNEPLPGSFGSGPFGSGAFGGALGSGVLGSGALGGSSD